MKINNNKSYLNVFQTIKGKVIFMGTFAIASAIIAGIVGIKSIDRNYRFSKVESNVNDLNILHKDNQVSEAEYRNYVEQEYLDKIVVNLQNMSENTSKLSKMAEQKYHDNIQKVSIAIEQSNKNYSEISSLSSKRGFLEDVGFYQQYLQSNEAVRESFDKLIDKPYWIEMSWMDGNLGETGEPVNTDGKVYISDIRWKNGSDTLEYNLNEDNLTMAGSGDAFKSAELVDFNGTKAICVDCSFNADNDKWEEFAIEIPIDKYAAQDYSTIEYDMYYEPTNAGHYLQYGGAYTGAYEYNTNLKLLDRYVSEYSELVVEGKDVSEVYGKIEDIETEKPYCGDSKPDKSSIA